MRTYGIAGVAAAITWLVPLMAMAAVGGGAVDAHGGGAPHLDGAELGLWWGVPFAGILLSIAIFPLAAPHFWEEHFGKVSALWIVATLVPFFLAFGWQLALYEVLHLTLLEYLPFIILLLALYTVAGGIHFRGSFRGSPASNTAFLAAGTAIASWTGTTGASMLLIRPVMRANAERRYKVHVIVFFIFLVSNIGGALTPLGDPPLFLGFLKGVDFFWPTVHVFLPMLVVAIPLLAIFFIMDTVLYRRETPAAQMARPGEPAKVGISGWANVALLGGVVAAVLLSGTWKPGVTFNIYHVLVELQNVVRDVLLLLITWVSWRYTDRAHRRANAFNWHPILEVAKLFAGIFVTIMPVIAILKAGQLGALQPVLSLVTTETGEPVNAMYFWVTGILSSFLDNAPTYLVFFNAAGGDAEVLMGPMAQTLLAISAGAVFMGANSYIGNAPNFMVKAIAESSGIRMPSFIGYLGWSTVILLPLFAVVTFIFFM
ncbi:MAG: sodium:proton antiporter [Rhodospirillales bacterium]|nr:sodium:proton antiporter [Rhodospirillales bacterium]